MFQTKVLEKIERTFYFYNFFFLILFVYGICGKNMVELGRPQMTIWHMHFACWIPKATYVRVYSKCVILLLSLSNSGFVNGSQCYMYIASLVLNQFVSWSDT